MSGCYRIIDEVSHSVLGTFHSQDEAIEKIAALAAVNSPDFLDELTLTCDQRALLYGNELRAAIREHGAARARRNAGNGERSSGYAAIAAKSFE